MYIPVSPPPGAQELQALRLGGRQEACSLCGGGSAGGMELGDLSSLKAERHLMLQRLKSTEHCPSLGKFLEARLSGT